MTASLGAGVALVAMVLVMCGFPPVDRGGLLDGAGGGGATGDQALPTRAPDPRTPVLGWGMTHTEYSADHGPRAQRDGALRELSERPMPQNQHIMGWGARNPEPSPGAYDFKDLDRRVALIRRTGGTPVLTLCCAPDWMKGGEAGRTAWDELETAPTPEHYKDFAELAGRIARRYPDIRHFVVWNEFKGFFDERAGRWNHEGYTELYNQVYTELKKVDRRNLVGGPYVVMDSYGPGESAYGSDLKGPWGSVDRRALEAVSYWNEHKKGADFVVVDGSGYTKDDTYVQDEFADSAKFAAVSHWLRRETGLPLWWAEWYVEKPDADDRRAGWSEQHRTAVQAGAMMELAGGGVATALYWNPQSEEGSCPGCLWGGDEGSDGGGETPMAKLLDRFGAEFPPGTRFREPRGAERGGRPRVRVLADDRVTLAVNTLDRPVTTRLDGREVRLDAYEVRWIER